MSCLCLQPSAPFALRWQPGDTVSIRAELRWADGSAIDLTGCTCAFYVAATDAADSALLWQIDDEDGLAILAPTTGSILLTPGSVASAALANAKTYPARLVLTTADGERLTFGPGYVETGPAFPFPA